MIYGYARKTSDIDNLVTQIKKLEEFHVDEVHIETISNDKDDIPIFRRLLLRTKAGDVIVVLNYNKITRDIEFLSEIISAAKEHYVMIKEILPIPK